MELTKSINKHTKAELIDALSRALRGLKEADAEIRRLEKQHAKLDQDYHGLNRDRVNTLEKLQDAWKSNRHLSAGATDIYSNLRKYETASGSAMDALARLIEMCEVMHQSDKTLKPHAELLLVMVRHAQRCLSNAQAEQRGIRYDNEVLKGIMEQYGLDAKYGDGRGEG